MARSAEKIVQEQLGKLLAEVAVLTAMVEQRDEEIAQLGAELKQIKQANEVKDGQGNARPARSKD